MRLFGESTSVITRDPICHSTHQNRWEVLPSLPPARLNQGPDASTSDQKPETLWCWSSWLKLSTHLFYILPGVEESRYPERRHTASDRWNRPKWESVTVPDSWRKCDSLLGQRLAVHTAHCPTHSASSEEWRSCLHRTCTQMPTVAYSCEATHMHRTTSKSFSKQRDNRHRAFTHRVLLSNRKGTSIHMRISLI